MRFIFLLVYLFLMPFSFASSIVSDKHYCQYAYINHNLTNDISSFGVNKETGFLEPLGFPNVPTGANPGSFYTHPNGDYLYVLGGDSNDVRVYKVDYSTGKISQIQNISSEGVKTWGGVLTPKTGEYLYVNNNLSNTIVMYRVDPNTGKLSLNKTKLHPGGLIANAPNGLGPNSIKITSNKKYAYVSNYVSNNLTIYHYIESTGDLVLAQPKAINVGGINPRQIALSPAAVPSDPTFIPPNKQLYILNQGSNSITQFDLDDDGLIIPNSSIPTVSTYGVGPTSMSIESGYKYLYSPNMQSSNIAMFSLDELNGLLTSLTPPVVNGGAQGKGIYTNLGFAYVTNFATNSVTTFRQENNGILTRIGKDLFTGGVNPGNITFTPYKKLCSN